MDAKEQIEWLEAFTRVWDYMAAVDDNEIGPVLNYLKDVYRQFTEIEKLPNIDAESLIIKIKAGEIQEPQK